MSAKTETNHRTDNHSHLKSQPKTQSTTPTDQPGSAFPALGELPVSKFLPDFSPSKFHDGQEIYWVPLNDATTDFTCTANGNPPPQLEITIGDVTETGTGETDSGASFKLAGRTISGRTTVSCKTNGLEGNSL